LRCGVTARRIHALRPARLRPAVNPEHPLVRSQRRDGRVRVPRRAGEGPASYGPQPVQTVHPGLAAKEGHLWVHAGAPCSPSRSKSDALSSTQRPAAVSFAWRAVHPPNHFARSAQTHVCGALVPHGFCGEFTYLPEGPKPSKRLEAGEKATPPLVAPGGMFAEVSATTCVVWHRQRVAAPLVQPSVTMLPSLPPAVALRRRF
jgi:hypothetical protein